MRAFLLQWVKTNRVILSNASSLMGTTTVTSVLGFAYWWIATRQFPPEAVGLASAAISAMLLLGSVSILGLGTLLIGELPRHEGKEMALINAAVILVGVVGGCAGIVFALVAPILSADFQILRASIGAVVLFAVGVSLTAITVMLDQAVIGLFQGELQFWRNVLTSVIKLAALFLAALWLWHDAAMAMYATWALGNMLSLVALAGWIVSKRGWSRKAYAPEWRLLRKLGFAALQHHVLNQVLRIPNMILPVMVTVLLSARVNAWFYVAFMIANFAYTIPNALTTVLYAINSAEPAILAPKVRLTLSLSIEASVLANCVLLFGTTQVLSLFGHSYAQEAAWSLRILGLATFPFIIKYHYIAICRIQKRLAWAILPVTTGSLMELGAAALGAHLGGLSGLSLGWVIALCVEAAFMSKTVFQAVQYSPAQDQLEQHVLSHSNVDITDTSAGEPEFDQEAVSYSADQ